MLRKDRISKSAPKAAASFGNQARPTQAGRLILRRLIDRPHLPQHPHLVWSKQGGAKPK